MRILTDPWVDGGLYFFRQLTLPVLEFARIRVLSFFSSSSDKTSLFERVQARHWLDYIPSQRITKLSFKMHPSALWSQFGKPDLSKTFQGGPSPAYSRITTRTGAFLLQSGEDYFATLGRYVRLGSTALWNEWIKLVEGDGATERVIAVMLGYTIAALLAALYLNTITVGNVKSMGRAVRNAVRQQMIVFKVRFIHSSLRSRGIIYSTRLLSSLLLNL